MGRSSQTKTGQRLAERHKRLKRPGKRLAYQTGKSILAAQTRREHRRVIGQRAIMEGGVSPLK